MPSLTGDEQRLVQAIGECQDGLLTLAGDLIKIPSENPPGDCTEVATWIHDYLRAQGIASTIHDAGDGRLNVISHRPGSGANGRHLVLSGHHDVVPVGDVSGWTFPPFAGDVVDGFLRGRGASDMKAGLGAALFTYVLAHRLDLPLAGTLSFVSVSDEEMGGPRGADWVLDQGLLAGATAGIIAEPSERTHPTIGQKGSNWFRLTIKGTPGHGSLQPLHGVSANLLAARAILALQELWEMRPQPEEAVLDLIERSKKWAVEREGYGPGIGEVFSHVTINIGTVRGGSSPNVVADTCVVEIDTRVPIGLTRGEVLARVDEILAREGIAATIEPLGFCSEPNYTLPGDPIVETLVGSLRELTGDDDAEGVLQWASSDARTFRSHGIPVLQYGPATLSTIHGFDEKCPAADVVLASQVYGLTTLRYLNEN